MENGFYLNVALRNRDTLTVMEKQHNTGYRHYAKVYLGTDKAIALSRAGVFRMALTDTAAPHEEFDFRLTDWRTVGTHVPLDPPEVLAADTLSKKALIDAANEAKELGE